MNAASHSRRNSFGLTLSYEVMFGLRDVAEKLKDASAISVPVKSLST